MLYSAVNECVQQFNIACKELEGHTNVLTVLKRNITENNFSRGHVCTELITNGYGTKMAPNRPPVYNPKLTTGPAFLAGPVLDPFGPVQTELRPIRPVKQRISSLKYLLQSLFTDGFFKSTFRSILR